jgi:hypothetical protein
MNCTNCGNQLPSDAKFCNNCGKSVGVETTNAGVVKINKVIEQISNHLEFLGYKTEFIKASKKGEKDVIFATHPQHTNKVLFELFPNLIMFRINLTTKAPFKEEMNIFLNRANKVLNCLKVFYDIEENMVVLRFEAVYTGEYNKEVFAQFLDLLENDITLFRRLENFDKLF